MFESPLGLAWMSGEGHGLAFMWSEFNPSPTWSCITEAFSLQIKADSITADGARIYPYPMVQLYQFSYSFISSH